MWRATKRGDGWDIFPSGDGPGYSFVFPLCAVPAIILICGGNPFHPLALLAAVLAAIFVRCLRNDVIENWCMYLFLVGLVAGILWILVGGMFPSWDDVCRYWRIR
jgi:Na+/H+ antiporter NhaC